MVVVLPVSSVVAVASSPGVATVSTFEVLVSSEGDDFSSAVFSLSLAVTSSVAASGGDGVAASAPVDTVSRGLIPVEERRYRFGYAEDGVWPRFFSNFKVRVFVLSGGGGKYVGKDGRGDRTGWCRVQMRCQTNFLRYCKIKTGACSCEYEM